MAFGTANGEREVILIGLGEFGTRTVGLFKNLISERRHRLPAGSAEKVSVYDLTFDTHSKAFRFQELSQKITERVKDAQARKFSGKFSYIFVGDLFDAGTALYAVDYAYLPWVIEQTGTLKKRDVLGFFTFSDELGASVSCSSESMARILGFFKKLDETDRANLYQPPYPDANGRPFAPVDSPNGPFDRNYVVVTPGGIHSVMNETSQVFAERIFYELFYLSDSYERLASSIQAKRQESNGFCLCTFSMIQISRLSDLQRYFLTYTLEDKVTDFLLSDTLRGTDIEYFERKFFEMLDVPLDSAFPLDRAETLFVNRNRTSLQGVLSPYVRKSESDFSDYIQECKFRIDSHIVELAPKIAEFVRTEMDNFLFVLNEGFTNLFRIDRFTGNISAYISFVTLLRDKFEAWEKSLEEFSKNTDEVSLERDYDEVAERVEKLQNSLLYKIPIFVPLRRRLIESAILSLPVEEFFSHKIRLGLARAILDWWHDSSPVRDCDALISDLSIMKVALSEKKEQVQKKMGFLKSVPEYYYIISEQNQSEYSALLERIKSRNFGSAKKGAIEEVARDVFKSWTENRDLQGISKDPTGFVHFVDSCIEQKCREGFGVIEENADSFARYASESVGKMRERSEQLTQKSFHTQNAGSYLAEKRILLNPAISGNRIDPLGEALRDGDSEVDGREIPNEFTLGSVVYFKDYLYLSMNALQKFDMLKKYAKESVSSGVFESSRADSGISDAELSRIDKNVRAILLDYWTEEQRVAAHREKFGSTLSALDRGQVNALSQVVSLKAALSSLSAEQLSDFAKDVGAPLSSERERQEKLIERAISLSK